MQETLTGRIFNIQRFSIHDGPGIRTTVFMKGCNLRCFWCHNPESIHAAPELRYYPDKCVGCGACRVCPQGAHTFDAAEGGVRHLFDRTKCTGCGRCTESCYSEALVLDGKEYDLPTLVTEVKKDLSFYASDGGVTFSGGEPLLQAAFVAAAAEQCRAAGMTVAVDTAGNVPWEAFEAVLPHTDYVLFDVKHWDSERHRAAVGVPNGRIVENLTKVLASGVKVRIRVPLIPGVNASSEDADRIAALVADCQTKAGHTIDRFEFMPFHGTAIGKYQSLGLDYAAKELTAPLKEEVDSYYEIVRRRLTWRE